jgi:hypothetical protein
MFSIVIAALEMSQYNYVATDTVSAEPIRSFAEQSHKLDFGVPLSMHYSVQCGALD